MDHEFFSSDLDTTLAGWDWFSLQLDDGTELMLYRLRGKPGTDRDWLSGSFISKEGDVRPLPRDAIAIASQRTWTSPTTGAVYPSGWSITIAPLDLTLSLSPDRDDQELDTRGSTGVVYWEGSVSVTGTRANKSLTGVGYVELTGYDGRTPMRGPPRRDLPPRSGLVGEPVRTTRPRHGALRGADRRHGRGAARGGRRRSRVPSNWPPR
jgi:hypothetical protein